MKDILHKITNFWKYNDWIGHGVGGYLVFLFVWLVSGSPFTGALVSLAIGIGIEVVQRDFSTNIKDYGKPAYLDIMRTCLAPFITALIV